MSDLVEDYLQFTSDYHHLQQTDSFTPQNSLIEALAQTILKSQLDNSNIKIEEFSKINGVITLLTFLKPPLLDYDLLVRIRVDFKHKNIEIESSFLQGQQNYPKIPSPMRRSVCRKLLILNRELWINGFKLVHNMQNGSLILLNTLYQSKQIFKSSNLVWNRIKNRIRETLKIVDIYNGKLNEIINPEKHKLITNNSAQETTKLRKSIEQFSKILWQISISHIKFGFKDKDDLHIDPVDSKVQSQQQTLMRFIQHIKTQNSFIETHHLYHWQKLKLFNFPTQGPKLTFQPQLQSQYASYLKTPVPKELPSGENKFILNQIELVQPQSLKLIPTSKEGGLNKIYSVRMQFYYCSSSVTGDQEDSGPFYKDITFLNSEGMRETVNPVLKKTLAIKVPKNYARQRKNDKCQNEFNIIKLFKSGVSPYILKYYKSDQNNFEYRRCLMMDYLQNAQPLSSYIEIYRQTLSLNSKVHLLINVANALRFIDDYSVVHMDMNLNNILVSKDYMTKLIDFGEAFCQKLRSSHGNTFKRGYTFPFCSPEYFERKSAFTIKQDVFSLGMIMYRLIFGDFPFFPSPDAIKSYKNKSYRNKIFLAPERGADFGNGETIELLYRIIFRCLSEDESIRCEPNWITIFLKLIYYHFL